MIIIIFLHLHLKRAALGRHAGAKMGSYHGVFLDDSSGVAVVDVNRPAVVALLGGADGDV